MQVPLLSELEGAVPTYKSSVLISALEDHALATSSIPTLLPSDSDGTDILTTFTTLLPPFELQARKSISDHFH